MPPILYDFPQSKLTSSKLEVETKLKKAFSHYLLAVAQEGMSDVDVQKRMLQSLDTA